MSQTELPLDIPVDPDPVEINAPAIRLRQPIGDLYIASISYQDLVRIAFFDVRRLVQSERDVERYLGIQRPLIRDRVSDLESYVNFSDASFPTAVIVAVDEEFAVFNEDTRTLTFQNHPVGGNGVPSTNIRRLARVIDGQHRIAGLMKFDPNHEGSNRFDVPVTVFIGSDIADQAHIFATVNLEQTKVSKSLAYDLYELANTRSPQKTAHNIAVALNSEVGGPLQGRIKRLGIADLEHDFQPLTQATVVEAVLDLMSPDPKGDRDNFLRGRQPLKFSGRELDRYIFRNLFVEGRDVEIASCLAEYFAAVRERWPESWSFRGQGQVLNRSMGFRALMRALRPIYLRLGVPGDVMRVAAFVSELAKVNVADGHFSVDEYPPGSSGEARLFRAIARVD